MITRSVFIRRAILAAALTLIASGLASRVQAEAVADRLQSLVSQLEINGRIGIAGETIAASRLLARLYEINHFNPLWRSDAAVDQLLAAVRAVEADGLKPNDYHLQALESVRFQAHDAGTNALAAAERDMLLTDSLVRLAFHLYIGKVDPRSLHPRWNVSPFIGNHEAAARVKKEIENSRISRFLDSLRPDHYMYRRLQAALKSYRQMATDGCWKPIPDGPLIEKGMRDDRVPLIRRRLTRSGDLAAAAPVNDDLFDDALEDAVARFQDRHRVDVFGPAIDDRYGAVGAETRAHMNLPVAHQIDRIRVNLERARWVLRDLPDYFMVSDIAGFEVSVVEQDTVIWKARSQVGDIYRETPMFQSAVTYMEINPTWTVPPGILNDSILPNLRKGTDTVMLDTFQVFDLKGRRIDDPETIAWSRYTGKSLPFRLVQPPGPTNPVGRIKFIFPNPDFVFMHDTPEKDAFDFDRRDFSAGCIRVERPFELAVLLMQLDGHQDNRRVDNILKSGKTGRIRFSRPIPIILFYRTVATDPDGGVHFLEDIYGRDQRLLDALDGPEMLWKAVAD